MMIATRIARIAAWRELIARIRSAGSTHGIAVGF
jgi:hypothetical protein